MLFGNFLLSVNDVQTVTKEQQQLILYKHTPRDCILS